MTQETTSDAELVRFRRLNRRLALATTLAILLIAGFLALALLVVGFGRLNRPTTVAQLALAWSPSAFYLWALWTLRGLFADLAREGPGLRAGTLKALARIGWALVGAGAVTLAIAPLVVALETTHRFGWFATFNVPALTLCMLGLALVILGRMLKRAIHIEARVKTLEATLEGFI